MVYPVWLFAQFVHKCFLRIQQKLVDTDSRCQPSGNSGNTAAQKAYCFGTRCVHTVTDVLHFASMQAFFVKDYIMNHPEDGEKIGRLRELMFEQVCNNAEKIKRP